MIGRMRENNRAKNRSSALEEEEVIWCVLAYHADPSADRDKRRDWWSEFQQ